MKWFKYLFVMISLSSYVVHSDPVVDKFGAGFLSRLPTEWSSQTGTWEYFDVVKCFTQGVTCFGNNPTTPYGFPVFRYDAQGNALLDFKMNPNDAIVIFFRAPPKLRYFGLTQYLFNRGGSVSPVFASLSDTFNNSAGDFETSLKAINGGRGESLYDNYIAVVWAADVNTKNSVVNLISSMGISAQNVNFIPMPYELPIFMGETETADSFGMLMRNAMPEVQANFDAYKEEKPFFVVKVGPIYSANVSPAPILGYRDEETGYSESATLKINLDTLVADIKKRYSSQFLFNEQSVSYTEKTGWDCISGKANCNGDNHDARYSSDITKPFKPKKLQDAILVVGVNHQKTGKALYINHSVYDIEKLAGIASVNDTQFTVSSALYHAGYSLANKAKTQQYQYLYAYLISYDCAGLKYCLTIPQPTDDNPVGLEPGEPFHVVGRAYVDPRSGVRPSLKEIVKHRSFIMIKR